MRRAPAAPGRASRARSGTAARLRYAGQSRRVAVGHGVIRVASTGEPVGREPRDVERRRSRPAIVNAVSVSRRLHEQHARVRPEAGGRRAAPALALRRGVGDDARAGTASPTATRASREPANGAAAARRRAARAAAGARSSSARASAPTSDRDPDGRQQRDRDRDREPRPRRHRRRYCVSSGSAAPGRRRGRAPRPSGRSCGTSPRSTGTCRRARRRRTARSRRSRRARAPRRRARTSAAR